MAYKLPPPQKKSNWVPKTTELSTKLLNCAHAQDQMCQTTSEMEEKFSFHAADEVIDIWIGIWADRSQIMASLP